MRKSQVGRLESLESEYLILLKAALEQCASGVWGLFGHNDRWIQTLEKRRREQFESPEARQLIDLGSEIDALRLKLGYTEPFAPHERLMAMRASVDDNTLGEPKRAKQWLDEMADSDR